MWRINGDAFGQFEADRRAFRENIALADFIAVQPDASAHQRNLVAANRNAPALEMTCRPGACPGQQMLLLQLEVMIIAGIEECR